MKLSTEQKLILERLARTHETLVLDRGMIRMRLQEMLDKELESTERLRSKFANDAVEAGIPKTHIGAAIGTRDWATIQAVINLTQQDREREAIVSKSKDPWVWDEEARTVTLYKWGGNDFFPEEETGTFVVRMVYERDRWHYDRTQEVPKMIIIELGQYIEPVLNGEASTQPVVPPVPDLSAEAFTYRAWTPEDDEKDGSEW